MTSAGPASLGDQIDQQIVLDSDRKMASYSPEVQQKKSTQSTQSLTKSSSQSLSLSNSAHPIACIFTVFFKCISLGIYLFLSPFLHNVITFIIVLISSALDFWVVKNVTGRLLVGLRWWSYYDDKGEEVWRFESFDGIFKPNFVDQRVFWGAQLGTTAIWGFFLIGKIFSLSVFWGVLNLINFGLGGVNLYGYYKCRGDYRKKLQIMKAKGLQNLAGRLFLG